MFRDATVKGSKVTLLDPPGATLAGSDWIAFPSTSSDSITPVTGLAP